MEEKKGDCRILQITMTDMKLGNGGVSRVVVLKESFQNEAGKMYWAQPEPQQEYLTSKFYDLVLMVVRSGGST